MVGKPAASGIVNEEGRSKASDKVVRPTDTKRITRSEEAYDFVPGPVRIFFLEDAFSGDHEVRMRRFLSAPAVMIVSASLLAQISPSAAKPRVPPPTCMVSGRLITAAEGSPLKSARVSLLLLERSEYTLPLLCR